MILNKSSVLIILFVFTFFLACKKEKAFSPTWDLKIATPILKTTLTIDNLISDTFLSINSDSSLTLVYHNTIYSFDPNKTAIKIPDTTVQTSYKIGNISLADQTILYPYSLGNFCVGLGLAGNLIINNNGGSMIINPISNQQSTDQPIDASSFFETATVQSGTIDINIKNGFPVDISNLVFQIKNQISGSIVSVDTFTNLNTNSNQTKSIDLSGKYVEGTLIGKIIDMDSPGSNGNAVLIDTSDVLLITFSTHNLKVDNATATFPSQNIIDEDQETTYSINGGAKLTTMKVKSGTLQLKINSTIPEKTFFNYSLPSATNGTSTTVALNETLPAAPAGSASSIIRTIDLAGYTIDLRGISGNKYNTFVNHLKVSIDSTGASFPLSHNDSVYINYGLVDMIPEYIEGYLGQQIVEIGPEEIDLGFFNKIKSGTIQLQDVNVELNIENGLGAEGRINIYDLKSIRNNTNTTVQLNAPSIMNSPLFIPRGTDNPLSPSITNFTLTNGNSNIKQWIENLPDKINYRMDVFLNPYGNTNNYLDFAYADTRININMDLQMPLAVAANQLKLIDTIDFNLNTEKVLNNIKDGVLHLICDNGLPLFAKMKLTLLDENGNILFDLIKDDNDLIAAAPLNSDCKVYQLQRSVIDITMDENKMQQIKLAKKAIITAVFDTDHAGSCTYLKIYNTYHLGCKLTGNFTYYTGN